MMPVPRGLVRMSRSPGPGPALGEDAVGMHHPGDRQAVFHLRIFDAVAAHQQGPGLVHLVQPAPEHRLEDVGADGLQGKAGDIQGHQGPAPHGIDVT